VIARLFGDRRAQAVVRRVDRPQTILLAVVMAALAAVGWLAEPFWLAVVVAAELALGGLGAVYLIGPVRPGLGFARYTTLAMAGLALTLFGRFLPAGVALLLVPAAAILLWTVVFLELRTLRAAGARTALDLLLTSILFAAGVGILALFPRITWPPSITLVVVIAFVLALRAGEARGASGAEAVGQAALHGLAVAQVAAAVTLLELPGVVAPALVALTFYAWGGAAEALQSGSSPRAVAMEFGTLAVLGLLVALFLHRG
jgi:hypothetical protein